MMAAAITGAHHGHIMLLALTTALANAPTSAAPSLVQPKHLNCPSHVIHITQPATPHYIPHEVTPTRSAYAHTTPCCGVRPPEPLLHKKYLAE